MHSHTHGTHGEHKPGVVDRAKDLLHKTADPYGDPYVDPAVPHSKQDRYGNEDYANKGGTPGAAYDTTPGYDPIAAKSSDKAYGTSTGVVGTGTGTGDAYTTPGYGTTAGHGTTAEYGTTGTGAAGALGTGATYGAGHPDKAAVLDSYGAIVTEQSHLTGAPVDPLATPAVIGVDAAHAHGAPVIPSTYNVEHTAHNTGPVVGAVDHNAAGVNTGTTGTTGYGTTDAGYAGTNTTGATHSTTATTGSAGTEHHKKGLMANIKEKVHDITDKLHHKK